MASIRKRKWGDGREAWVVDYKDQGGKRAIQTFATKKRLSQKRYRHPPSAARHSHPRQCQQDNR